MSAQDLMNSMLDATVENTEFESEFKTVPEIDSAFGQITKWDLKAGSSIRDGEERPWARLELTWNVDSPEAREEIGRDEVNVKQQIMLSFEPGTTSLSKTQNITLGRLIKLFDIEASELSTRELFDCFVGKQGTVKVGHVPMMKGKNDPMRDDDGNQIFRAEIVAVGRI